MADQIQAVWVETGDTLYALVRNSAGQIWQTTTTTFVNYVTANLANYAISLTEQGTASRYYTANFPAAVEGTYAVVVYKQLGGSPAETDLLTDSGNVEWTGTNIIPLAQIGFPQQVGTKYAVTLLSTDVTGNLASDVQTIKLSSPAAVNLANTYSAFETGTAQGGAAASITLRAGASSTTGYYNLQVIFILSGTGVGQTNTIVSYDGTTKIATVETTWAVQPDNTSQYLVVGRVG